MNAHRVRRIISKLGNDLTSQILPTAIPMPRHERKEDEDEREFGVDRMMKLRSK